MLRLHTPTGRIEASPRQEAAIRALNNRQLVSELAGIEHEGSALSEAIGPGVVVSLRLAAGADRPALFAGDWEPPGDSRQQANVDPDTADVLVGIHQSTVYKHIKQLPGGSA